MDNYRTRRVMANEWIFSSGQACYDTVTPDYALSQDDILKYRPV